MNNFIRSSRAGRSVVAIAVVAGALALAACGGGGDAYAPDPLVTDAVPVSATSSVSGLITYMLALVAIKDDTLKPIDLGGVAALPTDDTALPTPLP